MVRVTSGFFVAALIRRVASDGGFAAVMRKGAEEAGAILVVVRDRHGHLALFKPAPQTAYGEGVSSRRFVAAAIDSGEAEIGTIIERETRFDSDVWVVELEPAGVAPEAYIDIMPI